MTMPIFELELNDSATHPVMREDGPTVLNISVHATLEDVFQAHICSDLRDLFRRTLNGPLTPDKRAATTIQQALDMPDLAPQWIGALLALDAHITVADDAVQLDHYLAHQTLDDAQAVQVPLNVPGRMWCETHIVPADGPALGALAVIDLDADETVRSARLTLTGLGPVPMQVNGALRQLHGQALTEDAINAVVDIVMQDVTTHGFGASDQLAEITRAAFKTCRTGHCL